MKSRLNYNETKRKEVSLMFNNIKKIREEKGLSQEELAKLLKISVGHLNKVERRKRTPSLKLAVRIAKVLNCSLDELFF
jgi:putative transcriptional regulator